MMYFRMVFATAALFAATHVAAADITVSAAASLSDAFKEIAAQYERQYPQDKIRLNTAGSGTLLQQALKGAPVDVLAFADQATMDEAVQKGLVAAADRSDFARNSLVVVVPKDSTLVLRNLSGLAQPAVSSLAISNPDSVPVGRYAKAALVQAGLWDKLHNKAVYTQHVRQSLDYVARAEADAGFVYGTDAALRADKVKTVLTVPTGQPVRYPIASVKDSPAAAEGKRFIAFVRSAAGQAVLQRYGFLKP